MYPTDLSGLSILVMGLGLHGGGLATVRYLVDRGAECTVTDLRSEEELRPVLEQLPTHIRLVLGCHEARDFAQCDLVVKNPAVPRTAPMLKNARAITTDIALFLAEWDGDGPLIAITGTKGKSTTAGAVTHALRSAPDGVKLGGNITISPLSFLDELTPGTTVVLELSSFQLGDLRFCREHNAAAVSSTDRLPSEILFPSLRPHVAVITSIFRDHLDYYGSMESYVADKRWIYRELHDDAICIFPDDEWGASFTDEATALGVAPDRIRIVGTEPPAPLPSLPEERILGGTHMRHNLSIAMVAADHCGIAHEEIVHALAEFPGVKHRMEIVAHERSLIFINDTAATIPDATLAAVDGYHEKHPDRSIVLIAGGTDKELDLGPLHTAIERVLARGGRCVLLAGTATDRLLAESPTRTASIGGPFDDFEHAFTDAVENATTAGSPAIVLLSPGCASFGMFKNEFDRGDRFRTLVQRWIERR